MTNKAISLPPRIVISAPQGRSGKTIVSIGLCAALKKRGLVVQSFKKGTDYIDPSWLTAASGRACRNLDSILMPEKALLSYFQQACLDANFAVIDGAMGLYDGLDSAGLGSTAQLARLFKSPVILVINTTRMTRSIAAMVGGYQRFESDTNVAGIILNNLAGSRHESKLVNAIEQYCKIPVVGGIPKDLILNITERHLGIVPFHESGDKNIIEEITKCLEKDLDLNKILEIAKRAKEIRVNESPAQELKPSTVRIGVMFDRIFNFYYPDNLEALEQAGAELIFIDSMRNHELSNIDGLYIGGGLPELFLPSLESNTELRRHIAQAIERNMPVYAEAAGLMYLCKSIKWRGHKYEMVGAIPAEIELTPEPQGHDYVKVEVAEGNPFFPLGATFLGHEFHHSKLNRLDNIRCAFRMLNGQGIDGRVDGIVYKNVFAAYTHLHALSVPEWAEAFCALAMQWHSRPLVPARKPSGDKP